MSITASITPPALCLSRNQIPLRLSAPDAYKTPATTSDYRILMAAPDTLGDTLKLEWTYQNTNHEVTFTIAAASNAEANEVAVYTGAGSPAAFKTWITTVLIPVMDAHPTINEFFTLAHHTSGSSQGIRLRVRPGYYGNLGFAATASGFAITTSFSEGTIPALKPNYAARIFVSIAPLATSEPYEYIRLPEIQGFPNAANQIDIDLQPLLQPYFRKSNLPPLLTPNEMRIVNSAPRAVKIEYAQQSGEPLVKGYFKSIVIKVLQGGVATHDWITLRSDLAAYFANTPGNQRFLTNRKVQRVYPRQPQYLHWYQATTPSAPIRMLVRPIAPKPVGGTVVVTAGDQPVLGAVLRVPVGRTQYTTTFIDKASRYEVFLELDTGQIDRISEKITFHGAPQPTGLTIIEYQNQWGVPETMGLPWTRQRIAAITKESYERATPLNYTQVESSRIALSEQLTDSFELTMPANDTIDGPHIPEILMSPETYIIVDGTTRIPCTIEGGAINQEQHSRRGQQWPQQTLRITLDRQISWSRIINLTNLCK